MFTRILEQFRPTMAIPVITISFLLIVFLNNANAASGQELYDADCRMCHGAEAVGG